MWKLDWLTVAAAHATKQQEDGASQLLLQAPHQTASTTTRARLYRQQLEVGAVPIRMVMTPAS